jgi:hypothetical protein
MKLLFLFDAPYNCFLPIASRAFVYFLLLYGLYFSCHYAHNWMASSLSTIRHSRCGQQPYSRRSWVLQGLFLRISPLLEGQRRTPEKVHKIVVCPTKRTIHEANMAWESFALRTGDPSDKALEIGQISECSCQLVYRVPVFCSVF